MLMTQGRNLSSIRLVWCMVIWLLTSDSAWGQTFGRLQIRSQPNGATVSITQGPRQVTSKKTPAEWVLQPGTYQVRLSKNGYQDLTFSVKILADKKRSFAKVMQKQATNSGAGNVPVSGTTANHVLEAARQSFRNRKKYYIGNQNDAFFPGALELAKGVVPGEFREVRRFQYSQGPISANGALPGDVFVLRRGNKRDVLVYAGEFRFPDSVSKKNYSFFYYPFRQKSGMQLNTYPMRYEHHWMTSHKLLTPSKNGKQQMYSSGSSHEVAKFVSAKIDRHTVKFLKNPGINGRLIARHPPAEVIVYRRELYRLRTIQMVRFKETSLSTISRFEIEGTNISGYFLEPPGPSTAQSGKNRRIPPGIYDLRITRYHKRNYIAIGVSNEVVAKSRRILIHIGNYPVDTEGCLLPGETYSRNFVGPSEDLFKKLRSHFSNPAWQGTLDDGRMIVGAKLIITEDFK
ncbi:MAG: PEGA domain-containing protein [Planctomycetaceae bacterium]|nr:PEGA domain-containing protein [Planctomycetaceae bacterium]